jgi:DNA-3-methyladenine glycosylase
VSAALGPDFFARSVHDVARELIGCTLTFEGVGGVIVETEAYDATDPACHAYNGPTRRNEPLFGPPGRAYVYLSYGIHQLLNAVAEPEGCAAAVLIRALEPTTGIAEMQRRRGTDDDGELCSGPGKLTQALGVGAERNGASLCDPPFSIAPAAEASGETPVVADTRIGITRAADLPWRYCEAGSRYLSRPLSGSALEAGADPAGAAAAA